MELNNIFGLVLSWNFKATHFWNCCGYDIYQDCPDIRRI